MSDDATKQGLWEAVLAFGKALPNPGNHSRTAGTYVAEDDSSSYSATFDMGQPDGTGHVYELTVSVRERVDTRDDFWSGHSKYPRVYKLPADVEESRRVVVDGEHYTLGPGNSGGYGGRRWEIEFFDGRRQVTHDLWHQGVIPPKWRERYPNNARFVPQPQTATDWAALLADMEDAA
ncbi:hypothetical protein [Streptomyces sp. CB03911]|uniref:hypothetical protein n=1 Tax=Streptomyces sp. CB03911 TaxID=1804758 RepID=UPI00093E9258|nr:hypothetical protein [Streptomyces sp. CB03911]OKI19290.1 hypothetical protein A6A07_07250 [Streptomyces sp. CB03911]